MGIRVHSMRMQSKMPLTLVAISLQSLVVDLHQVDTAQRQVISSLAECSVQAGFLLAMRTVDAEPFVPMKMDVSLCWCQCDVLNNPDSTAVGID
jgi:hypothetical protein